MGGGLTLNGGVNKRRYPNDSKIKIVSRVSTNKEPNFNDQLIQNPDQVLKSDQGSGLKNSQKAKDPKALTCDQTW